MKKESNKNIPVVILCGGMGTRLVEYTEVGKIGGQRPYFFYSPQNAKFKDLAPVLPAMTRK